MAYCLVGKKLSQSVSPFLHGVLGCKGYTCLETEDLKSCFPVLKRMQGFNVTMPYKTEIMSFLDEISDEAKIIGSVNTVKREGDKLVGYNTDAYGMTKALKNAGIELSGKVLVAGSGGAARSAVYAAKTCGADVSVLARNKTSRFLTLCRDFSVSGFVGDADGEYDLIINATPVGTLCDDLFASTSLLDRASAVFDMVYNPTETAAVAYAKSFGKKAVSGYGMLAMQAVKSREIFDGACSFDEERIIKLCRNRINAAFGNIVLCGYMGSGKTTVGRMLASALLRPFIDIDEEMALKYGDINELFFCKGEPYFRMLERELCCEKLKTKGAVIALGGGSYCDEAVRKVLQNSYTVYLQADEAVCLERIKNSSRPLKNSVGLLAKREPIYLKADAVVNANGTPQDCLNEILGKAEMYDIKL